MWPLLLTADGAKFGKSAGNAVWLDPDLTSPYAYYQWWMNADDRDVVRFLRLFTYLELDEIDQLAVEHEADPAGRHAHRVLAREATRIIHGDAGVEQAENATAVLFGDQPFVGMDDRVLADAFEGADAIELDRARLEEGVGLLQLLTDAGANRLQRRGPPARRPGCGAAQQRPGRGPHPRARPRRPGLPDHHGPAHRQEALRAREVHVTAPELGDPDEDMVPDADGLVRRSWAIGGAALSALEGGEPDADRDSIVLLHGIPSSAELWRDVMVPLVAAGHHVVAFDLPGYGQTLLPARADHSLAGAAELVATWIRIHLGRGAWLVGHDLGGAAAQILVSRHPTLLTRLTLADTVFEDSWPVTPVRMLQLVARAGLYPVLGAARLMPNPYMWREVRRGFADPDRVTPELAERVFFDAKVRDDDGRRAFARHLQALDPLQTVMAAGTLQRLPAPSQLIWGEQDVFQTWDTIGTRLRDALDAPSVTQLPDTGHFSPVESPDAFARAMLDWEPGS